MLELIKKMLCILLKISFCKVINKMVAHMWARVKKSVLICLFKRLDQWKLAGGPTGHFRKIKSAFQQNFSNLSSKMLHEIVKLTVMDVRFPTSLEHHGSDAMVRDKKWAKNGLHIIKVVLGPRLHFLHAAAHRPGLFCRLCGDRNGVRTERFRPNFHSWKRHRDW